MGSFSCLPAPSIFSVLCPTSKCGGTDARLNQSSGAVNGNLGKRTAAQQSAEAPRARTSSRIWEMISAIQLFACEASEVIFGSSFKDAKVAIVTRELGRIFNDPANIINCREQIVHRQEQLKKLGLKINSEEIKRIISGLSQENLALLYCEFVKSEELCWFVDLLKEKSRDNFEKDLLVNLQAYFSIPFENININVECRKKTLQVIKESVENFKLANYDELHNSVKIVLLKVRSEAVLRYLQNGGDNFSIATELVNFLTQQVESTKAPEQSKAIDIRDQKKVIHFSSTPTNNPTQYGATPTSSCATKKSSAKTGNIKRTEKPGKIAFQVKEVFSALSNLNCKSKEDSLTRAAYSLIKLGSMVAQGTPLNEIRDELSREFARLDDDKKKRVIACSSSGEMYDMELTGRKIRSSIGMKINQDAIDLLNKNIGSAGKKHVLDDIQRNVNFVLDVILDFDVCENDALGKEINEMIFPSSDMHVEEFFPARQVGVLQA